jgi:hypothetical protein
MDLVVRDTFEVWPERKNMLQSCVGWGFIEALTGFERAGILRELSWLLYILLCRLPLFSDA